MFTTSPEPLDVIDTCPLNTTLVGTVLVSVPKVTVPVTPKVSQSTYQFPAGKVRLLTLQDCGEPYRVYPDGVPSCPIAAIQFWTCETGVPEHAGMFCSLATVSGSVAQATAAGIEE